MSTTINKSENTVNVSKTESNITISQSNSLVNITPELVDTIEIKSPGPMGPAGTLDNNSGIESGGDITIPVNKKIITGNTTNPVVKSQILFGASQLEFKVGDNNLGGKFIAFGNANTFDEAKKNSIVFNHRQSDGDIVFHGSSSNFPSSEDAANLMYLEVNEQKVGIGEKPVAASQKLTVKGGISASGTVFGGAVISYGNMSIVGGDLQMLGAEIQAASNITASGNISASGTVSGITGSFPHFITTGETIEFRDTIDGTRTGLIKYDKDNGFELRNQGDTGRQILKISTGSAEKFEANNVFRQGNLRIENSNVRTTGLISASGIQAPGFVAQSTGVTIGSVSNKIPVIVHGAIKGKGSLVNIESGSISASAAVQALTGSFGTGTTTITDNVSTGGTILAVGNITSNASVVSDTVRADNVLAGEGKREVNLGKVSERVDLIVQGGIKIRGSEITLMSGSISASSDISSSATVRALTGSFGTGTTTITDSITTTGGVTAAGTVTAADLTTAGTITANTVRGDEILAGVGKTEVNLGKVGERVDLIVQGGIRIKGSDIVMESGSIQASSDIIATGSISSITGSFDHIITLDDTIEFRDKTNKRRIKGYAKFDPIEGLVAHSASMDAGLSAVESITIMPKIANAIKKMPAQGGGAPSIGGVLFSGENDINLPGVNIAGNQDTTGTAAKANRATIANTATTAGSITPGDFIKQPKGGLTFAVKGGKLIITAGSELGGGTYTISPDA